MVLVYRCLVAITTEVDLIYSHLPGADPTVSPVGTFSVNAEQEGDSSGGAITLNLNDPGNLGFRAGWKLLQGSTQQLQSQAGNSVFSVRLSTRVLGVLHRVLVYSSIDGSNEIAELAVERTVSVLAEGATGAIYQASWQTNENTKTVHAHLYGVVYDMQSLAREPMTDYSHLFAS